MIFLEYNVDHPAGNRISRWWAAYTAGGSVYLPMVQVSSGHSISNGPVSWTSVYRGMVNQDLARPALGRVTAYSTRVGNAMKVWFRVVNDSGITLSPTTNQATVHAIVWEDETVALTGRYVRSAPSTAVSATVEPGMSFQETLQTGTLTGVNWSKLHTVALLDYRPGGLTGPYDILQAAIAQPADLYLEPPSVELGLAAGEGGPTEASIELLGPHTLTWTATADVPWLTVSPETGSVPGQAVASLSAAAMPAGPQQGQITFTASSTDGLAFTRTVTVQAELPLPRSRIRRRLFGGPANQSPAPPRAPGP